jgi:hypothetical protein
MAHNAANDNQAIHIASGSVRDVSGRISAAAQDDKPPPLKRGE